MTTEQTMQSKEITTYRNETIQIQRYDATNASNKA